MVIISRKEGHNWKEVMQLPSLEDPKMTSVLFLLQCGVELKFSWKDPSNGTRN